MRLIPTYMGNSFYDARSVKIQSVNPHVHGELTSNSAPFPSAIFYLGDHEQDFYHCFKHHGPIYRAIEEEEMMQYD